MNSDVLDHFRLAWQKLDPDATGFIRKKMLPDLLEDIGLPLGFAPDQISEEYKEDFI